MNIFLWIVGSAASLIGVGFLYQCIGAHRDRLRFAGIGRWVTIGRRCKLYLLEKGSGGPTVLFEASIAATNLNWFHIQETVSRFTGTASYDRSGLGWSSPCRTARTPGNIAVELHDLLQCAEIKPPYILVGHSFGGLVMRRYALLYPEDVQGIVLVDPMRCEEWPPLAPGKQSQLDLGRKLSRFAIPIARFGLARLAVTSLLCRSGRISGRLAGAAEAVRRLDVRDAVGRRRRRLRFQEPRHAFGQVDKIAEFCLAHDVPGHVGTRRKPIIDVAPRVVRNILKGK